MKCKKQNLSFSKNGYNKKEQKWVENNFVEIFTNKKVVLKTCYETIFLDLKAEVEKYWSKFLWNENFGKAQIMIFWFHLFYVFYTKMLFS